MTFLLSLLLLGSVTTNNYTGLLVVSIDNCPACKKYEPLVNTLIVEGQPIIKAKIKNVNDIDGVKIRSAPTTIIYIKGKEVGREVGAINEKQLRDCLGEIKK